MGVNDFLLGYYGAQRSAADPQQNGSLTQNTPRSVSLKMPKSYGSGGLAIKPPAPPQPGSGYGYEQTRVSNSPALAGQFPNSAEAYGLMNDKAAAENAFKQQQSAQAQQVAGQYSQMAAGVKDVNAYGVQNTSPLQGTDFNTQQLSNVGTITAAGEGALTAAQNARSYQNEQNAINANVGYNISYTGAPYDPSQLPAGTDSNSVAGQAIAMAMTAMHNHTPYTWGGTDLSKGVDCSGMLFTIYNKLGIHLPRSSYEQAKYGKVIQGLQHALPGDLIFYNTGSSDPNGIGVNSHVALYLGNGMVIEAENPSRGIVEAPIGNFNGTIMRPW